MEVNYIGDAKLIPKTQLDIYHDINFSQKVSHMSGVQISLQIFHCHQLPSGQVLAQYDLSEAPISEFDYNQIPLINYIIAYTSSLNELFDILIDHYNFLLIK